MLPLCQMPTQHITSVKDNSPFPQWEGMPYYPISQFYKNKFGGKVYKVPVSVVETCPNREGLKGMKTCTFCDVWGSAAYPEVKEQSLSEQILHNKNRIAHRMNVKKFLIYFQAYTNTFLKMMRLKNFFDEALKEDDVFGIIVGTRPDCISLSVLDLWKTYSQKTFLSVELGAQSFDNAQLKWMRRGHTKEQSLRAVSKISKHCPQVDLGIHLMFGLHGENDKDIIEAAKICSDLPIHNVKLHNLHVLKNTPLETLYYKKEFSPIGREEYTKKVILFLQHLRKDIAVHRLSAVSSRHDELVAPRWASSKMESYQFILDQLRKTGSYQGQKINF